MSVTEARPVSKPARSETAKRLALEGYTPPGKKQFASDPAWAALTRLGTQLWLDTGDLEAAEKLWAAEFTNLTTNNTLVNKEVQKGIFDEVIPRAARAFREAEPAISEDDLVREVGFVINCRQALRLVMAFDAHVSVELHPGMAADAETSVEYGRRYAAVCPERFIVKVPLTPGGFLAARRLSDDGIPINYTLGFSARQNVLAAAFSRPAFVNVFMGRLNSFVADNGLGDGKFVGERATMASQTALIEGRQRRGWQTRQIGASMRSGEQLFDLAGLDVFTAPTSAAEEYKEEYDASPRTLESQVGRDFPVHAEPAKVLEPLWVVEDGVYQAADALSREDTRSWDGERFARFVAEHGAPDLFWNWTPDELHQIEQDGKIPKWERWKDELTSGRLALDELMSISALYSFVRDQAALDDRIRRLIQQP